MSRTPDACAGLHATLEISCILEGMRHSGAEPGEGISLSFLARRKPDPRLRSGSQTASPHGFRALRRAIPGFFLLRETQSYEARMAIGGRGPMFHPHGCPVCSTILRQWRPGPGSARRCEDRVLALRRAADGCAQSFCSHDPHVSAPALH